MIKSADAQRLDLEIIAELTPEGARVLDVGCGEGELLELLTARRKARAYGLEISQAGVNASVARGLSVVQGDADRDLAFYPDDGFDLVVLSRTIQATRNPRHVLEELLRIGKRVIVSFPNFGHWRIRTQLLFTGRMPMTHNLPEPWYASPDAHLCTIKDFVDLVALADAEVEQAVAFNTKGRRLQIHNSLSFGNLVGEKAVFLLKHRSAK